MQQSIGSYQGKPIYAGTDANVSQQMFGSSQNNTGVNMAYPSVPATISATQMQGNANFQGTIQPPTPTVQPDTTPAYTQALGSAIQQKDSEYKVAVDEVAKQEETNAPIKDLMYQTGLQSDQYNQNFNTDLKQQFTDLNQFKTKTQELQNQLNTYSTETDNALRKMEIGNLGSGGTTGSFQDLQSRLFVRERDIRSNQIKAQLAGAMGQEALAQDAIDLYIKGKYDPHEQKIKNLERYLSINEKELERKDTKAYRAQQNLLAFEKEKLDLMKSEDEAKQKIMTTAAGFGAPNALLQKIGNAKTPAEAIQAATGYLSDPLEKQIKTAQLAKIYSDIRQTNIENQIKQSGVNGTNFSGKPLKVSNPEIVNLNEAITARNSVASLIDQFTSNINDVGTFSLYGKSAGAKDSLKTNLALAMKNLEKTGALDKGTIDVLTGTIPDNKFWTTEANQLEKLETLKNTIVGKTDEYINSYRGTTAELDPRTKRAYTPTNPQVSSEEQELIDAGFIKR
jgi:hypothetical protein